MFFCAMKLMFHLQRTLWCFCCASGGPSRLAPWGSQGIPGGSKLVYQKWWINHGLTIENGKIHWDLTGIYWDLMGFDGV